MGIPVADMNSGDTVFEWNGDDGETMFFAITRMTEWMVRHVEEINICCTMASQDAAQDFWDRGSIDQYKLDRITDESFKWPIIYCETADGMHILVDGHHRFVYAADRGLERIPTVILKPHQWEPFIVEPDPNIIMILL